MYMKRYLAFLISVCALGAAGKINQNISGELVPRIHVADLRESETQVKVDVSETLVVENAFFKRTRVNLVFTNPNKRVFAGELEFPIPDEAFVCGYALEIDGNMIPGVVCGKEKARVAFENEVRRGVDPGIVEHVKGNIWRTRIFPLNPNVSRRAEIEYIVPKTNVTDSIVYERDGEDVFVAALGSSDKVKKSSIADSISTFASGTILWDASMSARPLAEAWLKRLEALPTEGKWSLIIFRNHAELFSEAFSKQSLLKKLRELDYDGGTDIGAAIEKLDDNAPALLFSDELDTLGLEAPKYEGRPNIIIASRPDAPRRNIEVRKLAKGEKVPSDVNIAESTLLATIYAERRMRDLASQADARQEEFLALGRKYGVAGPGLSLIVLEGLAQYLEHDIEPDERMSFYAEWKRQHDAKDDKIALKKAKAEHEKRLLDYWEERVKWWNNPKPHKKKHNSGLFDGVANDAAAGAVDFAAMPRSNARNIASNNRSSVAAAPASVAEVQMMCCEPPEMADVERKMKALKPSASGDSPTISLKAWDPKMPYLESLKSASDRDAAYKAYLKEREKYGQSPAFYLDCAGWFYKAGERMTADRIISNLAEFKLEDAALWRSMGWRAREAGSYGLSILAFRKVLEMRGEEAQSRRDLALVLAEYGKWLVNFSSNPYAPQPYIEEAMKLFADAAFNVRARKSGRRSNDFQVSIIALEELNGLISWVESEKWYLSKKPKVPEFDAAYRRDLPVKLRIVLSWDADETDIDLHVLEPNGEEAFYGNRRTDEGGFVSEDVTTGYGPEEYLRKDADRGVYKILTNYFASHQTSLTGAVTITACVYTDWGTANEKFQLITFRLDKPKDKLLIGKVEL